MDINKKRLHEKEILKLMITTYCRGEHRNKKKLCNDCQKLLDYAYERIENCPLMETKSFCSACKTHCYSTEMRERIKLVMKYSGPKMLIYHPLVLIRHMLVTMLEKRTS